MGKLITQEKQNSIKIKQQNWQLAIYYENANVKIHKNIETILPVTSWKQARKRANESGNMLVLRETECMLRKRTIDLSKSESKPRASEREKPSFSKSVSSKSRACMWETEREKGARERERRLQWTCGFSSFLKRKGNVFVVFLWTKK